MIINEKEEGEGEGGVLPEEEDEPHLLPGASQLGLLAVLQQHSKPTQMQ